MIIGFDDTDSKKGMCTTYLAAVLIERLQKYGDIGIPLLIRLNPTIKYKTRGNAAIALQIKTSHVEEVEEITVQAIEELSELKEENTNPGVVFCEEVPEEVHIFSERTIKTTMRIDEARKIMAKYGLYHKGFKNQRGLIGALAAIGAKLDDYTYELITYRYRDRWASQREINKESVFLADRETYPMTWDTVDVSNGKIVFAPNSKCPVLYGIRGGDMDAIYRAHEIIESEAAYRSILFKTNQGTDTHLMHGVIGEVREGCSYILRGNISEAPYTIEGGHVIFRISDGSEYIDCAAFEPTKNFREIIRRLGEDDEVVAYGSVNNSTLNLEKIEIKRLEEKTLFINPKCPVCAKSMKSEGSGKGYRCKRCKTHADEKEVILIERGIEPGLYEVPPVARRHISKPLVREENNRTVHPSR